MEHTVKDFAFYLESMGFVAHHQDFLVDLKCNDDDYEEKLINHLGRYLLLSIANTINSHNMKYSLHKDSFDMQRVYNCFIESDDTQIIKLFKRIINTYNYKLKTLLQKSFLKWNLRVIKIKNNFVKSKERSKCSKQRVMSIPKESRELSLSRHKHQYQNYNSKNNSLQTYGKSNNSSLNNSYAKQIPKLNSSLVNKASKKEKSNISNSKIVESVIEQKTDELFYESKAPNNFEREQRIKSYFSESNNKHNKSSDFIHLDLDNTRTKQKQDDNQNHTNSYQFSSRTLKKSSSSSNLIFEKLYQDRILRDSKNVEYIKKHNQYTLKECTFRPQINEKTKSEVYRIKKLRNENDPIYVQLNQCNEARLNKINNLSNESQIYQKNIYTFKPNTKETSLFNKRQVEGSFEDRLFRFEAKKAENLEQIRKGVEEEFINERRKTFSNSYSNFNDVRSKSIVDPKTYQLEKDQKLRLLKTTIDNEIGLTFKPKINDNFEVREDVIKRNDEHLKRRNEKLKQLQAFDDYECTFTPKINTYFYADQNFCEKEFNSIKAGNRLHEYHSVYNQKKELLKDTLNETHPFKPELNKNTDYILERRRQEKLREEANKQHLEIRDESSQLSEMNDRQFKINLNNYERNEAFVPKTIEEEHKEFEDYTNREENDNQGISSYTHQKCSSNHASIQPLTDIRSEDCGYDKINLEHNKGRQPINEKLGQIKPQNSVSSYDGNNNSKYSPKLNSGISKVLKGSKPKW